MKKIILIFLCQFLVLISFAQEISGYQGKRLSVNLDSYIFPAVRNPTSEFNPPSFFSFNKRRSIGVDYVISRSSSVGMNFQFLNTGFAFKHYDNRRGAIAAKNVGFYIKSFHDNDIAPLGLYSKFELLYLTYNVLYSEERVFKNYPEENRPKLSNLSPYSAWLFSYSIGKQTILYNRLILNASIQTALNGKLAMSKLEGAGPGSRDYIQDITQARLFSAYLLNLNFGVGFLIF
ncbi:MAG: hypothetical protein M3Q58_13840 [Bacteroidota bacterium]|nr:hypothetical protein [Bacteroidota bacterium]